MLGKFLKQHTLLLATFMVSLLCIGVFSHTALAAPTLEINYQGKLTDTTGSAVSDGTYNIAFNLYTAGDTIVWSSTTTVPVQNGLFSYLLGSSTALTGVNFNQPLYLSVNIGGTGAPTWDGEMTPRKLLGTVPSAFEAQQLGGLATTSFLRADQADTANNLITFLGGVTTTDAIISGTATTTNLAIGGDLINELAGTGLTVIGNALTADLGTDIAASEIADGDHGVITYSSGVATFDNNVVTPDAILSTGQTDEYCLTYETGDSFEWQECAAGGSGGGGLQSIQVFDTAGTSTWTKPAGIDAVRVIVTGGGGGGGGAQDTGSEGSGGGGAGATAIEFIDVSATSTVWLEVGAGGAGGSGDNDGLVGATSSFSTFTAAGGGGGGLHIPDSSGGGGYGGTIDISGDINIPGGGGSGGSYDAGSAARITSGLGGASYWGGGGQSLDGPTSAGANGIDGKAFGSGGGGARDDTNTARSGGAGAPGIIVVYEYQTQGLATGTIETGTQGQLAFYENGGNTLTATSSLFLDTNGSFGIGTTSPLTTLDVWGNLRIGTTSNGYLSFGTTTGTSSYGIRNLAGTLQFKNNNGVWSAFGSGGASTLSDLSDVDTTGVAANDLLVYNGSSFVPTTLGTSSINATNYTDKYVLIASSTAPGGLAWVATSSLNITGTGGSGSQYLTNHTFTSAETWTPLSGLSSAQTIPLWVDTNDLTAGYIDIIVDGTSVETVREDSATTRVVSPSSSLAIEAVAEGFDVNVEPTYEQSFSVAGQDTNPQSIAFNVSGTKMFVVGEADGEINEYSLSTAFDVSTASFVHATSVADQETSPRGLNFNPDGTKMFVAGDVGQDINEYILSTGFDVSTASFVDSFDVSGQEIDPRGIAFNTDGTKMFITGIAGDDVNEYTLSTGFDVSTASFVDAFDISGQETSPQAVRFNAAGTKMFVVGTNIDNVNEYTLSTGFDVSTASFVDSFSVAGQEAVPTGLTFNTDGTKMFVVGNDNYNVNEYTLPAAFDINVTPEFVDSFSVAGQETAPQNVAFNTDGTKMFVVGDTGNDVNEYTLSTGFDVSTASFVDSFSVAGQDTQPQGFAFSPDGTKMFVIGLNGQDVNEYSLGTGFDVSTASFVDRFSLAGQETSPDDVAFNLDGTKMFVIGSTGNDVNEYTLSTGFDVSTASFVDSFSVAGQDTQPESLVFNHDGTKMFVLGATGDDVNEYTLSTGFDVSTASFVDVFDIDGQEIDPRGISFNTDGTKMFVVGSTGDDVNEYTLSGTYTGTTHAAIGEVGGGGDALLTDNGTNVHLTTITDNFSIGTTSDNGVLTVAKNTTDTLLSLSQYGTGDLLNLFDGTTEVFSILDGGNVGIGTSTPVADLHVFSNTEANLFLQGYSGNDYASVLRFMGENDNNWQGGYIQYDAANNNFVIGVHDTADSATSSDIEALTIARSTGNVGVGTSSPQAKLTIAGTAGATGNLLALASSSDLSASTTDDFWFSVSDRGVTDIKGKVLDPTTAGNWDPNDTNVMDGVYSVTVAGNYAYVAGAFSNNLTVVDISDPANPVTVGNWDPNDTNVMDSARFVTLAGNYAYVAGFFSHNLAIVDVSDPTNPTMVGNWDPNDTNVMDGPYSVTVTGHYAYVAGYGSSNLAIVDITDPANPVTVGNWDPNDSNVMDRAYSVTVAGHYAYVTGDDSNNLAIVDISDPANPVTVGNWDPNDTNVMNGAYSVTVAGSYAYVTGLNSNNLAIVDITDPANPVTVGNWDPNDTNVMDSAFAVTVAGNYAYVTSYFSNSLTIVDISSSTNPTTVSNWDPNNTSVMEGAISVTVAGNYAYVSGAVSDNLAIVDITGLTVSNLYAGAAEIDQLRVMQLLELYDGANIRGGLNVGQNTLIGGQLAITGNSSSTVTTNAAQLILGGSDRRDSYLSFLGRHSSTSVDSWSVGLDDTDGSFKIASSTALGTNDYLTISQSGNVGIGTTSPLTTLDVWGDLRIGTTSNGYLSFGTTTGTSSYGIRNLDGTLQFKNKDGSWSDLSSGGSGAGQGLQSVQVFDTAGTHTWTKPAGVDSVMVYVTGGGGGGGGADNAGADAAAGGAGAGATAIEFIDVSATSTVWLEVGDGGSGGSTSGGNGSAGGSTAFSTFVVAGGGSGGAGQVTNGEANGGAGGNVSTSGDIDLDGAPGGDGMGISSRAIGGTGGASYWGSGGAGGDTDEAGSTGTAYGSGGGGAAEDDSTGRSGGAGAPGIVVVYEYTSQGGADLAELYPSADTTLSPGDIVHFTTDDIEIAKATEDAHKTLAGVISTDPGIVLSDNTEGDNAQPVALAGRVPVKVNLEGGPIFPGDRIAPSSVPGVGRKAHQFEPTVGSAITAFTSDDDTTMGLVTVFVDLQEGFNTTYLTDVLFNQASTTLTASSTATSTASSTNTILTVFTPTSPTDTIWTRLYSLAVNFVDGVLAVVGVRTEEVCLTDETGETCIDRTQLNALLQSAAPEAEGEGGDGGGESESSEDDGVATSTEPQVAPEETDEPEPSPGDTTTNETDTDNATTTPPADSSPATSSTPPVVESSNEPTASSTQSSEPEELDSGIETEPAEAEAGAEDETPAEAEGGNEPVAENEAPVSEPEAETESTEEAQAEPETEPEPDTETAPPSDVS